MNAGSMRMLASVFLVALIALCLLWEGWLAPLRPGGSWLILKGVPLLLALPGVLAGRRYTSQWLSMLVLLYFTEGVVRAFDQGLTATLALIEIVLACALFGTALMHARLTAPSRLASGADAP
jgi:uncharacterized membrane protein